MGHRHDRNDILEGAVHAALADGLSQLTFGRLAKRLGINDRTIVYYFPSKSDLLTAVITELGERLQAILADAFAQSASDHLDVLKAAWPVLATPEHDPVFAVFFEANGLAAAGHEPYRSMIPSIVEAWIEWVATGIDGAPEFRVASARASVAVIDGLLLVRHLVSAEAADDAAHHLGIV